MTMQQDIERALSQTLLQVAGTTKSQLLKNATDKASLKQAFVEYGVPYPAELEVYGDADLKKALKLFKAVDVADIIVEEKGSDVELYGFGVKALLETIGVKHDYAFGVTYQDLSKVQDRELTSLLKAAKDIIEDRRGKRQAATPATAAGDTAGKKKDAEEAGAPEAGAPEAGAPEAGAPAVKSKKEEKKKRKSAAAEPVIHLDDSFESAESLEAAPGDSSKTMQWLNERNAVQKLLASGQQTIATAHKNDGDLGNFLYGPKTSGGSASGHRTSKPAKANAASKTASAAVGRAPSSKSKPKTKVAPETSTKASAKVKVEKDTDVTGLMDTLNISSDEDVDPKEVEIIVVEDSSIEDTASVGAGNSSPTKCPSGRPTSPSNMSAGSTAFVETEVDMNDPEAEDDLGDDLGATPPAKPGNTAQPVLFEDLGATPPAKPGNTAQPVLFEDLEATPPAKPGNISQPILFSSSSNKPPSGASFSVPAAATAVGPHASGLDEGDPFAAPPAVPAGLAGVEDDNLNSTKDDEKKDDSEGDSEDDEKKGDSTAEK